MDSAPEAAGNTSIFPWRSNGISHENRKLSKPSGSSIHPLPEVVFFFPRRFHELELLELSELSELLEDDLRGEIIPGQLWGTMGFGGNLTGTPVLEGCFIRKQVFERFSERKTQEREFQRVTTHGLQQVVS